MVAWSTRNEKEILRWADMLILNHNLFKIPVTDIHKTEVEKTLFKGRVVYEKS